jgi:hypothetical protein
MLNLLKHRSKVLSTDVKARIIVPLTNPS